MTIHKYNHLTARTMSIEKRCSLDCSAQMVGCVKDAVRMHEITCTYCCNKNYCNMDVAKTDQQALSLAESLIAANNGLSFDPNYKVFFVVLIFYNMLF